MKQKAYLLLKNCDHWKNPNICFTIDLSFYIDIYSNQFALSKLDSDYLSCITLSWVDKFMTER